MSGVVIVGAGLGGVRTAEELRRAGFEGAITLVGNETHLPYDRPPLSKEVVRGERDDTTLKPPEFFADKQIELRLGVDAESVDTAAKTVTLGDGSTLEYDQLVIATGLLPRRIPGQHDLDGVFVLRSIDDSLALREELAEGKKALIVGAGFIGCELAASFRARGVDVVLVEPQETPLASVLGTEVGGLVARLHNEGGVDLRCGIGLASLSGSDGRVSTGVLSDGTEVAVDLVVIGVGSVPVTGWLAESGIALADPADGGGVLADEFGRTETPGVWAVGDVAAWLHGTGKQKRVEHWTNAGDQAKALAGALVGNEPTGAVQVPYFWSDQYDVKIQALGTPSAQDDVHIALDDGRKFLAYYSHDGALTGVVGGGLAGKVMKLRGKVAAGSPVAELLE